LGIGGLPRGWIVEITGPPSGGKTTLAWHLAAASQRQGGRAAVLNPDCDLDPRYARALGAGDWTTLVAFPGDVGQALEMGQILADSESVEVIIIDSMTSMAFAPELRGLPEGTRLGTRRRLLALARSAWQHGALVLLLGLRPLEDAPGRSGYAALRLNLLAAEEVRRGGRTVGCRVAIEIVGSRWPCPASRTVVKLFQRRVAPGSELITP